jgi:tripartite-type tricarboxylate transporter receptor subunit TctC
MAARYSIKRYPLFVFLALMAGTLLASAQQYPARAIRLIVAFAAGGTPDIVARILANALEQPLGQSIVVDNRPGANGIVGIEDVATAVPDGYTVLQTPPAFVINPSVYKSLPFDIFRDFAPIANVGISAGYLVIVRAGLPVGSIAELIEYAKSHRVLYGSPGIGNTLHLAAALFGAKAGIEMEHVPFRGSGAMVTALLSRTIDVVFASPASASYIENGGLRAIGFTGTSAPAEYATVPLVKDTLPGFVIEGSWQGWLAPAKTPPAVIARLNAAIRAVLKIPSVHQSIVLAGYEPTDMSPEEFTAFLHVEAARYAQAVQAAKIEPQ